MDKEKGVKVGERAPDFSLPDQNGTPVRLADFHHRWVVLYFYPRDNTPGCTREAIDFTHHLQEFENLGASVLGISPDSVKSHCNFQTRHSLKVTLLSDPNHQVLSAYGAWKPKKLYGRVLPGVVRSTFLIDPEGKIAYIWMPVKVDGHAEEVKQTLLKLKKG